MLGRAVGLLAILEIYSDASNPDIFARLRNEVIGAIVLFLRSESHAVSLAESIEAARITGRFEGQPTFPGAYPLVGESGAPRCIAWTGSAIAASSSAEASPCMMIPASGQMLVNYSPREWLGSCSTIPTVTKINNRD